MSDILFYPLLWITVLSPLIWLLLFLLVRRRGRSKKAYFILLAVFSVILLVFTFKFSTASGLAAIGWIEKGIIVLGPYTLLSALLVLAVRLLLRPKQ